MVSSWERTCWNFLLPYKWWALLTNNKWSLPPSQKRGTANHFAKLDAYLMLKNYVITSIWPIRPFLISRTHFFQLSLYSHFCRPFRHNSIPWKFNRAMKMTMTTYRKANRNQSPLWCLIEVTSTFVESSLRDSWMGCRSDQLTRVSRNVSYLLLLHLYYMCSIFQFLVSLSWKCNMIRAYSRELYWLGECVHHSQ